MSLRTSLRSLTGLGEETFVGWFATSDEVAGLVVDGVFAVSLNGGALPASFDGSTSGRFASSGRSTVGLIGIFKEKSLRGYNDCRRLELHASKWSM